MNQSLPQYITVGQVVPFSFSITNTGSIAGTYAYKVYVVWNNGEQDVIDLNSSTLAPGASTRIPESLKFETASSAGTIHIEIVSPPKSLQFSLPRR